jgi:hypothetical protein
MGDMPQLVELEVRFRRGSISTASQDWMSENWEIALGSRGKQRRQARFEYVEVTTAQMVANFQHSIASWKTQDLWYFYQKDSMAHVPDDVLVG